MHNFVLMVDGMAFPLSVQERQDGSEKGRFSSGSCGQFISGKIVVDGKRHQFGGNSVEIGSNPNKVAVAKGNKPAVSAKL